MPTAEDDILALARQLEPRAQLALALALLRQPDGAMGLAELRKRSRAKLAAALKQRGVDIGRASSDKIDGAIQQICEEP